MKYCPNCGTSFTNSTPRCNYCNTDLTNVPVSNAHSIQPNNAGSGAGGTGGFGAGSAGGFGTGGTGGFGAGGTGGFGAGGTGGFGTGGTGGFGGFGTGGTGGFGAGGTGGFGAGGTGGFGTGGTGGLGAGGTGGTGLNPAPPPVNPIFPAGRSGMNLPVPHTPVLRRIAAFFLTVLRIIIPAALIIGAVLFIAQNIEALKGIFSTAIIGAIIGMFIMLHFSRNSHNPSSSVATGAVVGAVLACLIGYNVFNVGSDLSALIQALIPLIIMIYCLRLIIFGGKN